MTSHTVAGQLGRSVTVDLCDPCQAIWFDPRESLQLSPGATLMLFRLIGEHVAKPHELVSDTAKCPHCQSRLRRTQDMQRSTKFEYLRCPHDHGRLTTFFDFLKEKDFIRPLTPAQITELRQNVQAVNCSNCGASIDLANRSDCAHCGSALSMLDMKQAEALVTRLREADRTDKTVDPALPLSLARARREANEAFKGLPGEANWLDTDLAFGLVGAGLAGLARWLRDES
jgi:transcription elongation factor Elf1